MAFNKAKALQEAEKAVAQGKIPQAIKQYLFILEKEPSDLVLLNTVGDLYVREKNNAEALRCFHKLANSYGQEGFTLKAIAIYKKITKLDPNAIDVLVKLGELYTMQGLAREAREQYAQAVEFYKQRKQPDRALETFRKIVALDPENTNYRMRLAEFCEQMGKKADAAMAYSEAAEVALRHGDTKVAEPALKKASALDPANPQLVLMRARTALEQNNPAEAEKVLASASAVQSTPAGQQLLLRAYLGTRKVQQASRLVSEVYRANPGDFSPLASFAAMCLSTGDLDAAVVPLTQAADAMIEAKATAPLSDVLKQLWQKDPHHLPTLELLYKVAEKTADEFTLPEVLEALGDAYVEAGDLEKAEWAFRKLSVREPENENYKALLHQVLQKSGKEVEAKPADFAGQAVALAPEAQVVEAAPPAASEEEAALVKEALENSDLFSRYGLVDKAVAELEKVLETYPDQVDIHQRILEVCQKGAPQRAAKAAAALASIYTQWGDNATARKYIQMARVGGVTIETVPVRPRAAKPAEAAPPPPPPVPEAAPPQPAEFDLSQAFGGAVEEAAPAPAAAPVEAPLDFSAPAPVEAPAAPPPTPPPAPAAMEFDLSGGLDALSAPAEAAPPPSEAPAAEEMPLPAAAPPFNYEDARVEVTFYLEQGFVEEAQNALLALEEKYPGNPQVAELRALVESHGAPAPAAAEAPAPAPEPEAWELPAEYGKAAPAEEPAPAPAFEPEPVAPPPPAPKPVAPPPGPVAPPVARAAPKPAPAPAPAAAGGDLLGSLVGELESSLEGIEEKAPPSGPPKGAPKPAAAATGSAASPLSSILEELGEPAEAQAAEEDPQTHYDLGVAFREMNLLDEAIGEFQKVVRGAGKGKYPPNFLQACTLLATCFMDKELPAMAAVWYHKALELPGLDEEAVLALQYDLGVAYEKSGDSKTALEKFSEVFAHNIDYRDVAEKIRELRQQK